MLILITLSSLLLNDRKVDIFFDYQTLKIKKTPEKYQTFFVKFIGYLIFLYGKSLPPVWNRSNFPQAVILFEQLLA